MTAREKHYSAKAHVTCYSTILQYRNAPLRFEELIQEMRQHRIQPRAANAVALFRTATASAPPTTLPAPVSRSQEGQTGKQTFFSSKHSSLDTSTSTDKRSFSEQPLPDRRQEEQVTTVSSHSCSLAAEALQSMLAGDSGAWSTYLTVEEFIGVTRYNANYIKRLVRNGDIKSEERDGVRRIPLAELAQFALERVSEELAARVLARQAAGAAEGTWVVEADLGKPVAAARSEAESAQK